MMEEITIGKNGKYQEKPKKMKEKGEKKRYQTMREVAIC